MRQIKISTTASVTDWTAVQVIGSRWPRSFRLAQDLIVAAEKSMKGRQGLFSRKPSKGDVEAILRNLDDALETEEFGSGEPWDDAERMFRFLSQFSGAFPNWQAEYRFLDGLIPKILPGRRAPSAESDVVEALELLSRFLTDDDFQNSLLPDVSRASIISGPAVDSVPGGTGIYGKTASNPIPLNGPLGEISYLSRLRTSDGQRLLAHRIGSVGAVDVYETVSFDGRTWDRFFLDLYHPRKSRLVPAGYSFASHRSEIDLLTAVNFKVEDFPAGMPEALRECASDFGAPAWIPDSEIRALLASVSFSPPRRPSTPPPIPMTERDRLEIERSPEVERTEALAVTVVKGAEDVCGDIHSMLEAAGSPVDEPMEKIYASALRAAMAGAIIAARRTGLTEAEEEAFATRLEAAVAGVVLNPEANAELVRYGFMDFPHDARLLIVRQRFWPSMEAEALFRRDGARSDDVDSVVVRVDGAAVVDHVRSMFPLSGDDRARLTQMSLAFRMLADLQDLCDSCRSILVAV